ncbi:YopX family protein [Pediococcus pentosaceus]|uniref:YopX family protein n=1 Tax=Pediococcus pentosaceus TaxID=1255 RepID=UPI00132F9345|nr:YopX family protein [Pediococcus pentosaceus]KAF0422869.1 hypothetical protein GBO84_06020 [Pediococcus pentosaceus]
MIKFRAWIKTGIVTCNYVKPMTIQQMIHSKKSTFSLEQLNDLVDFEQFTGLKDANGKEIYEGDIVEVTSQYWGMLGNIYEVKFEQGAFYVKYGLLSEISPSISVIGNVHTNPELLEEDK